MKIIASGGANSVSIAVPKFIGKFYQKIKKLRAIQFL